MRPPATNDGTHSGHLWVLTSEDKPTSRGDKQTSRVKLLNCFFRDSTVNTNVGWGFVVTYMRGFIMF
jgi:hypothetical protein